MSHVPALRVSGGAGMSGFVASQNKYLDELRHKGSFGWRPWLKLWPARLFAFLPVVEALWRPPPLPHQHPHPCSPSLLLSRLLFQGIFTLTAMVGSSGCPGNLHWSHVGVFQWFCVPDLNSKRLPYGLPLLLSFYMVGSGSHHQVNVCVPVNQE